MLVLGMRRQWITAHSACDHRLRSNRLGVGCEGLFAKMLNQLGLMLFQRRHEIVWNAVPRLQHYIVTVESDGDTQAT